MKRLLCVLAFGLVSSVAQAITPFELPWVNHEARDTRYRSSDHPQSVFVLEFGANFCPACNENAANVAELHAKYAADERVQVLDISLDANDREIAAWIARHRPAHPVLKDVGRTVWRQVGAQYIPTVVITDCHGTEKYRHTATWDAATKAEIVGVIDGLLAAGCE